jgi:hypothetical protein
MQQSSGDMSLEEQLKTHGWRVYFHEKKKEVRYISPEYGISFLCEITAYEFELQRQQCNGNEGKALSIFLNKKKNGRRDLSDIIYGGRKRAKLLVELHDEEFERGGGEIGDSLGEDSIEEKQLKSSVSTEKDGKLGDSSNKGTTTVSVQVATKPEPIDLGDFIRPTKLLATAKATSASSSQGQIVAGSPNPIPKANDLGFFYREGPRRKTQT